MLRVQAAIIHLICPCLNRQVTSLVAKLGGKSDSEEVVKYSKEGKVLVTPATSGNYSKYHRQITCHPSNFR